MKTLSPEKAFEISIAIRDELNRHDAVKGCDAVLLCFSGDVDGLKLAHIKVNNPPELLDVIRHLVNYMGMHAYNLGVEHGLEKASNIIKAPTVEPPKTVT